MTGYLRFKWAEVEGEMILHKTSLMINYEDKPFPEFMLLWKFIKELKVQEREIKSLTWLRGWTH